MAAKERKEMINPESEFIFLLVLGPGLRGLPKSQSCDRLAVLAVVF